MTAPPRNAIGNALFIPSFAAWADLTFALRATVIPKNPAKPEQIEPKMYATDKVRFLVIVSVVQIGSGMKIAKTAATTTTKTARYIYSIFRNAFAPSLIASAISCILAVPLFCLFT